MIPFNIIVATHNSGETLARCLESVRQVSGRARGRLILIDGASTDDTLEIAEAFADIVDVVVSEPDSGVYDAWNKGLSHCVHPWVLFLGSDDYLRPAEFLRYLGFMENKQGLDFVSCRVRLVDSRDRLIREVGRPWEWRVFKRYMCTLHPGSFTSLEYISRVGMFDESLSICGDYELLLRGGERLKTAFWPVAPVCMRVGGVSDGMRGLEETLAMKLAAGHRHSALCFTDHAIAVIKYMIRTYLMRSR